MRLAELAVVQVKARRACGSSLPLASSRPVVGLAMPPAPFPHFTALLRVLSPAAAGDAKNSLEEGSAGGGSAWDFPEACVHLCLMTPV